MTSQLGSMAAEPWLYQNMRRCESALPNTDLDCTGGRFEGVIPGIFRAGALDGPNGHEASPDARHAGSSGVAMRVNVRVLHQRPFRFRTRPALETGARQRADRQGAR